jgi:choline-sulfatase
MSLSKSPFHRIVLLLLGVLPLVRCGQELQQKPEPPPIIIISIDTLRSDHLPAYGYRGTETPNIDALRSDSILFTSAWSHVPLTLPSHVTILTGLLPPDHGVRNNLGYRFDSAAHRPVTLALKAAGYDTGAAVSAYVLRGETGLRKAFDYYEDSISTKSGVNLADLQRPGAATEQIAEAWIAPRKDRPFFFLLHLYEPHAPYEPPPKFARFANPYDGEIAAADDAVGAFLRKLKESGIYDRALIILLSDHGEGLNDHGEQEHGIFLYREAIQVPLVLKLPKQRRKGETVSSPVGLIDVAPTVAEAAGVAWRSPGSSLLRSFSRDRRLYAETLYPRIQLGWSELRSLVDGRHHYIEAPHPELYDLASDQTERHNVLTEERRIYASMKQDLSKVPSSLAGPGPVSAEDAAKLTALGYLGTATNASSGPLPDPKDEIENMAPMREAAQLSSAGRRPEAIQAYQKILQKNPRMIAAWSAMASDLEADGRLEDAASAYAQAMKEVPELAGNLALAHGTLLLRMGRLDQAQRSADLAVAVNPGAAHHLAARIALARRDFPAAEREARNAMADPSYQLPASVTLAQLYSAQGRRDEALEILDQSLHESERRGTPVEFLQFARGDILMMLGRPAEAELAFREETRLFPSHLRAYLNLAGIFFLQHRPDEATEILEQMVAANPTADAYAAAAHFDQSIGENSAADAWRARARSLHH